MQREKRQSWGGKYSFLKSKEEYGKFILQRRSSTHTLRCRRISFPDGTRYPCLICVSALSWQLSPTSFESCSLFIHPFFFVKAKIISLGTSYMPSAVLRKASGTADISNLSRELVTIRYTHTGANTRPHTSKMNGWPVESLISKQKFSRPNSYS